MVKTPFLVLPSKSVYNCVIGRLAVGRLEAVVSTIHLKMRFYTIKNDVKILDVDPGSAKRCHFLAMKSDEDHIDEVKPEKKKKRDREADNNLADPDVRYEPYSSKEEGDDPLTKELMKKIRRPEWMVSS